MDDLEKELKHLLVTTLMLEDVKPEELDSEKALFGEGLALDSIDALELGAAIGKTYGVKISSDDPRLRDAFANIQSLAGFLREEGVGQQ
ncbi:MAG: acyl carrier protein [Myxococcales bacterium]|nr:acyl carrier protein [Myxococcales bacterium]